MQVTSIIIPIQVLTASVSFFSSTLMVLSIAWFGSAGSSPYRRIILGLSISDIFQSLAFITGPLSVPLSRISLEATNEVTSCQVNGFAAQVGGTAVVMYTAFLCIYYLYKLKHRMSDDAFKHKIERKLHVFIALFSLISGSVTLAMDGFHTNGFLRSFCSISRVPTGCLVGEEECDAEHLKRVQILNYAFVLGPVATCFMSIIITMGLLYHHVFILNEMIEKEIIYSSPTTLRRNPRTNEGADDIESINNEELEEDQELKTPQDQVRDISRLYKKEMTIQATLYVAVFCLMYVPTVISYLYPSFLVLAITVLFLPLGGFLNIFVYTRPKVSSLRRAHPECSRLRGFWLVLRAGGEIPDEVDLSLSCCHGCCRPPAWLESEYEYSSAGQSKRAGSLGIHLSRIGF